MNKINRDNYEIWFVDFKDGLLSPEQIQELNEFLDKHEDLKKEFELWCRENDSISYLVKDNKDSLSENIAIYFTPLGQINESNYEQKFFEYFEGDLNEDECQDIQTFLNLNPHLEKEFKIHESLTLQPEEEIVFKHKTVLYKKSGFIVWRKVVLYAAAACFILFIGFGINKYNRNTVEIVEVSPDTESQKLDIVKSDSVNNSVVIDFDSKTVSQESKMNPIVLKNKPEQDKAEFLNEEYPEVEIKEIAIRNITQLATTNNHRVTEEVVLVADLTPVEHFQDEAVVPPSNQIRKINLNDISGTIKQALADVADIEYKSEPIADGNKKLYFRIGSYSIEKR
jgi:hypothetical protein